VALPRCGFATLWLCHVPSELLRNSFGTPSELLRNSFGTPSELLRNFFGTGPSSSVPPARCCCWSNRRSAAAAALCAAYLSSNFSWSSATERPSIFVSLGMRRISTRVLQPCLTPGRSCCRFSGSMCSIRNSLAPVGSFSKRAFCSAESNSIVQTRPRKVAVRSWLVVVLSSTNPFIARRRCVDISAVNDEELLRGFS